MLFLILDCRTNGKLQEYFHPGLFTNGKWSCCDHRSKHSYGCTPAFIKDDPHFNSSPVGGAAAPLSVSPTRGGGPNQRKPLPPTPQDTNGGHLGFSISGGAPSYGPGYGPGYGHGYGPGYGGVGTGYGGGTGGGPGYGGGQPTPPQHYPGSQQHQQQQQQQPSMHMAVSTHHHQRGGHHISSYQHHNPPGIGDSQPPPPVPVSYL